MTMSTIRRIRRAVHAREIEFSNHALEEMDDDELTLADVRTVLLHGALHKRFTDDPRGVRYVVRGTVDARDIDIVCRFLISGVLRIITVYEIGDQTMENERSDPCEVCESRAGFEERLVTVYRRRRGQHFIFERVPARVCKACGHRYFSWDVAEALDRLMDAPETQTHVQPVPVVTLVP